MSTTTTRAVEAVMRLADELKMSPRARDEEWVGKVQEDYQIVQRELTRLRAALDTLDAMNPDDFRTGQAHLSPAFREINYVEALRFIAKTVNDVLHGTDEYGDPT